MAFVNWERKAIFGEDYPAFIKIVMYEVLHHNSLLVSWNLQGILIVLRTVNVLCEQCTTQPVGANLLILVENHLMKATTSSKQPWIEFHHDKLSNEMFLIHLQLLSLVMKCVVTLILF